MFFSFGVGRGFGIALLALVVLAGCSRQPYALSKDDQERFADRTVRVQVAGSDAPMILGVHDCIVYKAITDNGEITRWKMVLRSDWGSQYANISLKCTRQSIRWDGTYVNVDLCAQGISEAGGGCAAGGNYRSRDGEHNWEISRGEHWLPLSG